MAENSIPLKAPAAFNFQNTADWPDWIQEFEDFRYASGLNSKPEVNQVRLLLYTMGRESRKILASFQLSQEDQDKYEVVKSKFNSHFVIRYNEVYESAKFNLRKQLPGETVDQFSTALYSLAEHCNFGSLKTRLIRDRFVVGLQDKGLSESLQLDSTLTLETAIDKARQKEAVQFQQQDLLHLDSKNANGINAVQKHKKNNSSNFPKKKNESKEHATGKLLFCHFCGGNLHPRSKCPANNAICRGCKKRGHFLKVCLSKNNKSSVSSVNQKPVIEYSVGGIMSTNNNSLHVDINFNNSTVKFKVDSGAAVSIVHPNTKGVPKSLMKAHEILKGPDGSELKVLGKFRAVLTYKNRCSQQFLFVVDKICEPLLGYPALLDLEIINITNSVESSNSFKSKDFYKQKYPTLFNGLGKMQGEHTIVLSNDAVPHSLAVARRVPIPLRRKVKAELDRLENAGVIRKITKPTQWCSGLVPVEKPSGDIRICVDFTKLNKYVLREKTLMPTVEESLGLLGEAKVFTKLDANCGFFQIPLSKNSQELTTFITPFGRYCFTRLPFGITSAPEHFQHRMAQILEGLPGVVNQTDDTLIVGVTQSEHDARLKTVLDKLVEAGVTLNYDKCCFSVEKVKFLGHIIDKDGIRPDPSKISAIKALKAPDDVSGVRRILGMVNHVARFLPNLSSNIEPLRALLNKNAEFQWTTIHDKVLQEVKEVLCSNVCLAKYNAKYDTILSADASSFGLGAVLLQKQPSGEVRAVAYASRSLTPTESRYSQIEKEALAATWAAERFQQFLLGLKFILETDHKPLVALLGKMNIEDLPPRIQRFRIRLMRFNYDILYVPGDKIATADTLSRCPENTNIENNDMLTEKDIQAYVSYVIKSVPSSDKRLNEIKDELLKDASCSLIMEFCTKGWPNYSSLPSLAYPFWKFKDELTVSEGFLLKGPRLVIPQVLQKDIMSRIHDGHLGINKCRERAKQSVWWPGITSQIKEMVNSCSQCIKTKNNGCEPLIPSVPPTLPWEKVATDLFELNGKKYLLVTDYYSRYPEVCPLETLTSAAVIEHMKTIFSRHGIPNVVFSDNGPQYSSLEFKRFANSYGFQHITSSPRYAQSNGEAERMVQTIKNLMERSEDHHLALLSYRNTPGPTGSSPAQLSMGRRLKTRLPTHPSQLKPKWPNLKKHWENDKRGKIKYKINFDNRHLARELKPLNIGDKVWIKDMETPATIKSTAGAPRSYLAETPRREVLRRNRRHLIPMSGDNDPLIEESSWLPDSPVDENIRPSLQCPSQSPVKKSSPIKEPEPPEPVVKQTSRSGRVIKKPDRLDL